MHANRFGGVRQSPVSVSNLAIRHRGFEHGETGRRDLRVVQIQVFELGEFFQVLIPDITDVRINQRQKLEFWQRLQMYEAGGGDSRPISGPRGNLQAPKCQGVTTSFPTSPQVPRSYNEFSSRGFRRDAPLALQVSSPQKRSRRVGSEARASGKVDMQGRWRRSAVNRATWVHRFARSGRNAGCTIRSFACWNE